MFQISYIFNENNRLKCVELNRSGYLSIRLCTFVVDSHVRLRRDASNATKSDAAERRQSGRISLPGEREQAAGQAEHGVRHRQEAGTNQIRRMAESTFCFR